MRNSAVAQREIVVTNPEEKYCRLCGFEMRARRITDFYGERFDLKTGGALHQNQCVNPKCTHGCDTTGGHKFSRPFFAGLLKMAFGRAGFKCVRCGHYV